MLWDDTKLQVDYISSFDQILNVAIMNTNHISWILSVVYASPQTQGRESMWNFLKALGSHVFPSWLIVGDWNQVLRAGEKSSGAKVRQYLVNKFGKC